MKHLTTETSEARPASHTINRDDLRLSAIEQMADELMEHGILNTGKYKTINISDAMYHIDNEALFCSSVARWTLGTGNGNSAKMQVREAVLTFCERHIDDYCAHLANEMEELS